MSRILVIGGYGGFGARLCRRLAAAGHELLVGGRSADKAAHFCAGLPRARPLVVDRDGDVGAVLVAQRLDLVVDAAGPFQDSDYRVPSACIDCGIPYLDLADARGFVTGISVLDGRARTAGVAIIAGASSLPALSGAVARRLAEGMDHVHAVDIALSVSSRANGASVVEAILSYVGQKVPLWRGRRSSHSYGWQEMRREDFRVEGTLPLRRRLVAIADVPDLQLLPSRLPGRPAVTFRAGIDLAFAMRALWLASWPVRWGRLRSLRPAVRWLVPLYGLIQPLGRDRSAMHVSLKGRAAAVDMERRWTIIAEQDDGRDIPTLAASILAEDVLAGRQAPGAYNAGALLSLDRFEPAFATLALRHGVEERILPPCLYARVIGAAFERLPPMVRRIHAVCGDAGATGEGTVTLGRRWPARAIAGAMRFPPAGTVPLHVAFAERDGVERWTRDFGGHRFSSELSSEDGRLVERFGPMRFTFELPADAQGLTMKLRRWSLFRVPMPPFLAPRIAAREWEDAGRFRFDVNVKMPLVGEIVHYSGWLDVEVQDAGSAQEEPAEAFGDARRTA